MKTHLSPRSFHRFFLAGLVSFALVLGMAPLAYADDLVELLSEDVLQEDSPSNGIDNNGKAPSEDCGNNKNDLEGKRALGSDSEIDSSVSETAAVPEVAIASESQEESPAEAAMAELNARAHVQTHGWLESSSSGSGALCAIGTTGQAKRLEAISLSVSVSDPEGCGSGIEYRSHVQTHGWQDWVSDGTVSGTTGQAKRLEAIQIRLTGAMAEDYDVYYRVHVQTFGWLGWAKNGEKAGTAGLSKRVECVEILILEKSADAPGAGVSFVLDEEVSYTAHVQSIGWQGWAAEGNTAGIDSSLRLEALRMMLSSGSGIPGGISYRAHVQSIGWQGWAAEGETAGTTGLSLRVEAISAKLEGDIANYFDVYYRVKINGYGWLGWAKNGQDAGTTGLGLGISAYQVRLVAKGASAPGSIANHFSDSTGFMKDWKTRASYVKKANNYSSSTSWLILVDTQANKVAIFNGFKGSWTLRQFWDCTDGASSSPTIKGVFVVGSRGLSFGSGYTCWYWTQFCGNYLFHSVLYNQGSMSSIQDGRLGISASHGCVRLAIENAKWIYDNIPHNTRVVVY